MRKIIFFLAILSLYSCNSSFNKENKLIGSWKISSFNLQINAELSDAEEKLLRESIQRRERKMTEFAQYDFNKDQTYRMQFSPTEFDEGNWHIIQDSILVIESTIHTNLTDTVKIIFRSKNEILLTATMGEQTSEIELNRK